MTTIITKYGYGKPSQEALAKGEVAVDLSEGILYSSTDGKDVIELGRGELHWDNVTGKPDWIVEGDGYVDIEELAARVGVNESDIAALKSAVAGLEQDISGLEDRIDANAKDIADGASAIEANQLAIQTNKNAINTLNSQINDPNGLADQVGENTTNIGTNAGKIKDIEDLLDASLTGLAYGGTYDAKNNVVLETSDEGANAGLQAGNALPTGEKTKGIYVVVTVEGVLEGTGGFSADGNAGRSDKDTAHVGDWLVSDGQHGWILMSFGMDAVNWGMIGGSLANQTDLVTEFAKYLKKTDTIDCGTYS